ncbi:MAG: hypothetical protein JXM70_16395, partial [Pirellulales bacterium]|nr:hypothetical protein [Pirellulales bacterium]
MDNLEKCPNTGQPDAGNDGVSSTTAPEIRLDGGVLACACPECGAPMSIRLWLLVADCWQCGTSIELTEEQEQQALQLLREHEEDRRRQTEEAVETIKPTALRTPTAKITPATKPLNSGAPRPKTPPRQRPQLHLERPKQSAFANLSKEIPAWLVSMIFHMVLFMLLALWMVDTTGDSLEIFLSTSVSYQDLVGAENAPDDPIEEAVEFDVPGAEQWDDIVDEAKTSGRSEVALDDPDLDLPEIPAVLPDLSNNSFVSMPVAPVGRMFRGRDPKLRSTLVKSEGGTSFTEAAVTRGLEWIARHQNDNGSWSLHSFSRSKQCNGRCKGEGNLRSDVAATAMALLPMLGAGQTHLEGKYTNQVFYGLKWLIDEQESDGDLRGSGGGRMYAHGQAAIVLCEAYA